MLMALQIASHLEKITALVACRKVFDFTLELLSCIQKVVFLMSFQRFKRIRVRSVFSYLLFYWLLVITDVDLAWIQVLAFQNHPL